MTYMPITVTRHARKLADITAANVLVAFTVSFVDLGRSRAHENPSSRPPSYTRNVIALAVTKGTTRLISVHLTL